MEEVRDLKPSIADKVMIASRWIEQGYNAGLVLHSVGLASSTYYSHKVVNRKQLYLSLVISQDPLKSRAGRRIPGYSYTYTWRKISDEQIKGVHHGGDLLAMGILMAIKAMSSMQEDYGLNINHKKVYRLCKELDCCFSREGES